MLPVISVKHYYNYYGDHSIPVPSFNEEDPMKISLIEKDDHDTTPLLRVRKIV